MFHVKHFEQNPDIYWNIIDFLLKENQKTNLTGIKDRQEAYLKHIEDSIVVSNNLSTVCPHYQHILDLGTGAGFPGLIIALENQRKQVYLLDSINKKIEFIKRTQVKFNIKNITPVCDRAENYALIKPSFFDVVIARAVAKLHILAEYAAPFLQKNALFVALKNKDTKEELQESLSTIKFLGFEHIKNIDYSLNKKPRFILIFKKTQEPKIILPRQIGKAKKKPLRGVV